VRTSRIQRGFDDAVRSLTVTDTSGSAAPVSASVRVRTTGAFPTLKTILPIAVISWLRFVVPSSGLLASSTYFLPLFKPRKSKRTTPAASV
jgi:hypothetical protein